VRELYEGEEFESEEEEFDNDEDDIYAEPYWSAAVWLLSLTMCFACLWLLLVIVSTEN
jgi:hypothetical protein